LVDVCRQASEYCKGAGYPIEKLAMQFATRNPRIATTLFSSANPDNVRRNVEYVESEIDEVLLKEVTKIIGPHFGERWHNT
jgi:aryl-alcohol dehydrogenase-like predicted oxidoreductase